MVSPSLDPPLYDSGLFNSSLGNGRYVAALLSAYHLGFLDGRGSAQGSARVCSTNLLLSTLSLERAFIPPHRTHSAQPLATARPASMMPLRSSSSSAHLVFSSTPRSAAGAAQE